VIGAGGAGLAAAGELRRRGFRVAVHEARDRIGGRILTHRDPRFPMPLELGAEFIHGEAPLTERLLREARLADYDLEGDLWLAKDGHFHRDEGFWNEVDRVFDAIDARKKDVPFADFLARRPGGKSLARARKAARLFVQGFHAADPAELSTLSLAPREAGEPSEEAMRTGRVAEGYDRLAAWLARDLGDDLHLGVPVREIAWEPGRRIDDAPRHGEVGGRRRMVIVGPHLDARIGLQPLRHDADAVALADVAENDPGELGGIDVSMAQLRDFDAPRASTRRRRNRRRGGWRSAPCRRILCRGDGLAAAIQSRGASAWAPRAGRAAT